MQARNPAPPVPRAAPAVIALVALVALIGAGCSKKITSQLIPNQPPEVHLTAAPLALDPLKPDFYAYTMQWSGFDPDGRVDHFVIAVDPLSPGVYNAADTSWHATARNESTFFFSAGLNYDPVNRNDPRAQSPHVISIFAVDNEGKFSTRPATRAFFSFTQCPSVQVEEPVPNASFTPTVAPTTTIRWSGKDVDGQTTVRPVRWVFRLFGQSNEDLPRITDFISWAGLYPDSVRRVYAPDFPGWKSVGAETTSFQFQGLNPGSTYLFVITAFDEAGAYDPVFADGRNMVKFGVNFGSTLGPILRMFNQFFDYTYSVGGYDPSEGRWFRLEVPSDQEITFRWVGTALTGSDIRQYRWVMDLVDLTDETKRSDELRDWYHWSNWSRNTTSAKVGPFTVNGETHRFYIEAEDNNGLTSLGIIFFRVVRPTFDKELLFVDDTRLNPDRLQGGSYLPPIGPWPTAAELDTFLFARGGVPWRGYPDGTLSPPGIFNGYAFDTVGTRGLPPDGTVPLSTLGQYRHVVWYTDPTGASYGSTWSDQSTPVTALRLVNSPGKPVILSTYMSQGMGTNGGFVWLAGGGAAYASLITWNKSGTSPGQYDNREPNPELRGGRMMYDFVHWREGIQTLPSNVSRKFDTRVGGFGAGANRPGRHWPANPPLPTPPFPPNYALLPSDLQPKSNVTDPPPPYVDGRYVGEYTAEHIYRQTFIREDYNPDPDIVSEFSTLDTLYLTRGGAAPANSPVMTYYHGLENQPIVFSGFNFWYWRRAQCIQLVDWVLHEVWGLQRDPTASRSPSAAVAARPAGR